MRGMVGKRMIVGQCQTLSIKFECLQVHSKDEHTRTLYRMKEKDLEEVSLFEHDRHVLCSQHPTYSYSDLAWERNAG